MSTTLKLGTLCSFLAVMLSGCGGGGGSDAPASPPVVPAPPAPVVPAQPAPNTPPGALAVKATSYENFKAVALTPQNLPASVVGENARGFADFTSRGGLDLFTASLTYDLRRSTPSTATASRFEFWRKQADGSYVLDKTLLSSNEGCIHPRKAAVADFNNDGRPDVFVACHGWDAAPFPGEKNKVVLSQPNGTYAIQNASDDVGFFHAATAADLNGDGFVDVVVVNNFDPQAAVALLNKGNGTFARETTNRFPAAIRSKPYFSVELVDVNEDGKLDLIMGGHEWNEGAAAGAATVVMLSAGNSSFQNVTPIVLPAVANEGVVLDFTVTGTGTTRAIWVLRTSGGDGTFYQSRVVQKVMWPSLTSSVASSLRPGQWIPWIIPATVSGQNVIAGDASQAGLIIQQ
jgi:hypothetical protein